MTTLTKTFTPASPAPSQLRPFDVRHDLEPIADLVELCFADTLDGDGRSYLAHMRSSAKQGSFLNWAAAAADWANVPFAGYVWQEGDRLVGNISLIPYYVKGRRFFLIANVAVHPDYRRRGIARSLTEKAVEFARQKNTPSVWLHVREENQAAVTLYQSMGFFERARRTTWYSNLEYSTGKPLPGIKIVTPRPGHWQAQRTWLLQNYPPQLSWHMPFNLRTLQPGWFGEFFRFLYNAYIQQWGVLRGAQLVASASWQATYAHANVLWLAAPADADQEVIRLLLLHACRHAPSQRPLMLDFPAGTLSQAIQQAGFQPHQTLIWMEMPFQSIK